MGAVRRKRPDIRHRLFAIDATLRRSSLTVNPLWPLPRRLRSPFCRRVRHTTSVAVILIVEDEASVAELIADTLIQRGYEARVAVSAAHASMIVSTERPDVIMLDINVPDSAGTVALGRLRQLLADVPVIMLTANADDELARASLTRGAFDYISRPFDIDHLIRVVEFALVS